MSAFISDDAADSNTVIDAWKWAEWEHANIIYIIYLNSDNIIKYLIYDIIIWQRDTAQNDDISVQITEKKTEQ